MTAQQFLKAHFPKKLDLTGGSDADMDVWDVEKRITARVLFECDPAGFTEACFTDIQSAGVTFPSYQTYGKQQADVLKELSATEDDYETTLQWAPSLTDDNLKALNETFGAEHRYLVGRDGSFRFETVGERIDRWKNKKLYTPTMTEDGVLDRSKETRPAENLKKASRGVECYFYDLLQKYITKEGDLYKCCGKVIKTIDVRGLENLVFTNKKYTTEAYDFWKYVLEEYPGSTFLVLTSFRAKASEARETKITGGGTSENQWSNCIARTDEGMKEWDDTHLPKLEGK